MAGLPILDLTDTQAVLGCAGLSRGDVSHENLLASRLEDDLAVKLAAKVPNYQAHIDAAEGASPTPQQQMLALAIKNYARWLCAAQLAGRWGLYKQLISDGKTRNDRFDRMDLSLMQANIKAELGQAWALLLPLLPEGERPVRTVPKLFGISSPTTDPVTDTEA